MCHGSVSDRNLMSPQPPAQLGLTDALLMNPTSAPLTFVNVLEWKLPSSVTAHLMSMPALLDENSTQVHLID